jgi:SAM-dependent methyltransferase
MRNDAIPLEERRLQKIDSLAEYHQMHERHRIFPGVLKDRQIRRVLDVASGVGVVGSRIATNEQIDLLCNDISPKCLQIMEQNNLRTVSFDLDDPDKPYPFENGTFDAVISLAVIEHLMNMDHFFHELLRILREDGYLFISAPNYSGLTYLLPFLVSGKTFHDPLDESQRYEFMGHVKYFTFRTLLDVASSYGFAPDTVYLPVPQESSRFKSLKDRSPVKAMLFRQLLTLVYHLGSPRWAAEPVICLKNSSKKNKKYNIRKVVL